MRLDSGAHLTYCSNIHPGESWPELRNILRRFLPEVKSALGVEKPFGVGLRVSGSAADALADGEARGELRSILEDAGLYVFTINGFPYGAFHGTRVKEEVYLPDWRDPERLRYTNLLADMLADILPDEPDLEGSISTVPGAFKPNARTTGDVEAMAAHMVDHVGHLLAVEERTGRRIALALEPEPCCFLETIGETVDFFRSHLHGAGAVAQLSRATGLDAEASERALRRHLGVCLDLCHAAVEYEDPEAMLAELREAGVSVPKMQLSAGLRLAEVGSSTRALLEPFNDAVYLHQVIERTPEGIRRHVDLPQAFESLASAEHTDREWRVHFHVPLFLADLGAFASTQQFVAEVLALHRARPVSRHLEVETYTWDVLPERYRNEGVTSAVARELDWVLGQLDHPIP